MNNWCGARGKRRRNIPIGGRGGGTRRQGGESGQAKGKITGTVSRRQRGQLNGKEGRGWGRRTGFNDFGVTGQWQPSRRRGQEKRDGRRGQEDRVNSNNQKNYTKGKPTAVQWFKTREAAYKKKKECVVGKSGMGEEFSGASSVPN